MIRMILLVVFLALPASAEDFAKYHPDNVLNNGMLQVAGNCTDNESGESGSCFLFSMDGESVMIFVQERQPIFVRRVTDQGYEQVWPEHQPGGNEL